ncbi:hypothetical protein JL721_5826 [Aureococcus anophagefferens]|nr:hypothetical protein JL721_5826 [Aureococcus anophagefferens]
MRASLDDAPPDERRRALVPFAPIWRAFAAFTQSDVGKFAHFVERADPYDVRFTLPVVMCAYVFDSGFIDAFRLDFDREAFTATFGRAVTCEAVGFFRHHSPHFADGAAELCLLIAHLMVDGSVEKLKFLMMGAHGGCGIRGGRGGVAGDGAPLFAVVNVAAVDAERAAAARKQQRNAARAAKRKQARRRRATAGVRARTSARRAEAPPPPPPRPSPPAPSRPRRRPPRAAAAASAAAVAAAARPAAAARRSPGARPAPTTPAPAAPGRAAAPPVKTTPGRRRRRPGPRRGRRRRAARRRRRAETPAPPGLLRLTRADPALGAFERLLKDRYAEVRPSSARHSRDAPRAQVINATTPAPEIIFYII